MSRVFFEKKTGIPNTTDKEVKPLALLKMHRMPFKINNRFSKNLPADPNTENSRRQVTQGFYSFVTPKETTKPQLLHVSDVFHCNYKVGFRTSFGI